MSFKKGGIGTVGSNLALYMAWIFLKKKKILNNLKSFITDKENWSAFLSWGSFIFMFLLFLGGNSIDVNAQKNWSISLLTTELNLTVTNTTKGAMQITNRLTGSMVLNQTKASDFQFRLLLRDRKDNSLDCDCDAEDSVLVSNISGSNWLKLQYRNGKFFNATIMYLVKNNRAYRNLTVYMNYTNYTIDFAAFPQDLYVYKYKEQDKFKTNFLNISYANRTTAQYSIGNLFSNFMVFNNTEGVGFYTPNKDIGVNNLVRGDYGSWGDGNGIRSESVYNENINGTKIIFPKNVIYVYKGSIKSGMDEFLSIYRDEFGAITYPSWYRNVDFIFNAYTFWFTDYTNYSQISGRSGWYKDLSYKPMAFITQDWWANRSGFNQQSFKGDYNVSNLLGGETGLKQMINNFHNENINVTVYIEGTLVHPSTAYGIANRTKHCIVASDKQCDGNSVSSYMDPANTSWVNYLNRTKNRLLNYGFDGVYFDSLGALTIVRNYALEYNNHSIDRVVNGSVIGGFNSTEVLWITGVKNASRILSVSNNTKLFMTEQFSAVGMHKLMPLALDSGGSVSYKPNKYPSFINNIPSAVMVGVPTITRSPPNNLELELLFATAVGRKIFIDGLDRFNATSNNTIKKLSKINYNFGNLTNVSILRPNLVIRYFQNATTIINDDSFSSTVTLNFDGQYSGSKGIYNRLNHTVISTSLSDYTFTIPANNASIYLIYSLDKYNTTEGQDYSGFLTTSGRMIDHRVPVYFTSSSTSTLKKIASNLSQAINATVRINIAHTNIKDIVFINNNSRDYSPDTWNFVGGQAEFTLNNIAPNSNTIYIDYGTQPIGQQQTIKGRGILRYITEELPISAFGNKYSLPVWVAGIGIISVGILATAFFTPISFPIVITLIVINSLLIFTTISRGIS